MSASEIQLKCDARATLTISLANLASLVGQQSTLVANANQRHGAIVTVVLRSAAGTPPTAGGKYRIHLLRSDGNNSDDNALGGDGLLSVLNAPLLGEIEVTANAARQFTRTFDTWALGPLGPSWGIAVVNGTDQPLHASGNSIAYQTYVPEAQ